MNIYASIARAARCVKPHKSDAATDSAPGNFDAAAHPIIGEHIFGIEPFRPIGRIAAEVVAELQRTTCLLGPGELARLVEMRRLRLYLRLVRWRI